MLLENVTTRVTYSGTRLSSKFTKIKDITVKEHQRNIVHYVKYPESKCSENYTGETARRLSERVLDHNGRDAKSHLVKHAIEKCHKYPKIGYKNNTLKRRFFLRVIFSILLHWRETPSKMSFGKNFVQKLCFN